MRRFVIDRHGASATGEGPHAYGVEWPDGRVTLRLSDPRDPEPVHFRSIAGMGEAASTKPRFLDPPASDPKPTGKLPSERITEIAMEHSYPVGNNRACDIGANDVIRYLDERLGRAP